ncbi:MAG: hypothetical protein RIS86_1882 [Planctomycetota bacterium]|jgi:hypothetical protein
MSIDRLLAPVLLAVWLVAALPGCTKASLRVGVDTRTRTYADFGDAKELLRADPPRVGVLPTIGNDVGRAMAFDMALEKALRNDRGGMFAIFESDEEPHSVVHRDVLVNACIATGLEGSLQDLLAGSRPQSLLPKEGGRRIAERAGVEYLLLPRLVDVHRDNATRFSFAGFSFLRTGWTTIEAALQLWHAPTGMLVWQSTAEATLSAEGVVGISPSVKATMDALLATMLTDLVTGRSNGTVRGKIEAPETPVTTISIPASAPAPAAMEKGASASDSTPTDASPADAG